MGDHANDAINDMMDYEDLRLDYRMGNLSIEEAHDQGIIDELGYDMEPRRAHGRVHRVLCQYCNKPAKFVSGEVIYPHRIDLSHRKFYYCKPCSAYVGCFGNGQPFGTLANKELRNLRSKVHSLIDPIWKSKKMTRTDMYKRLAKKLEIPTNKCHVAMFDVETCLKIIELFKEKNDG